MRNNGQKNNFAKTIFVTGGAGFIGSNYLNKFVPVHPDTLFVNIDSLTYAANLKNLYIAKQGNYRFEKTDIRNETGLKSLFKKYRPDGIINFAAESHVDISIKSPNIFIETNVLGTHNLLSMGRNFGLKRLLQISTDEVYGALTASKKSSTESSPLAPGNPYSATKTAAEHIVRSYYNTFGTDVVITRSSNNYGPNQDKTKLIPSFISKLLQNKKVPLYSRGENIRDWLYVEDNIDAIDLVFRNGKSGETYNIGANQEKANIDVTKQLLRMAEKNEKMIEYIADRPGHDFRYSLDVSKIKRELGWKPKVKFDEGLAKTFDFYKRILANR